MKWRIPSKTFLLGEYAAVAEASAIILITEPYFELSLNNEEETGTIHPHSPAGLWWQQKKQNNYGLSWHDPYQGLGGLGASSAQFLGSYLASCYLDNKKPQLLEMLTAYYQSAWSGIGLRPSGYDVLAQSHRGCVYINKQKKTIKSYSWLFKDLSFLLIHTKSKLATHHHLQETALPKDVSALSDIVEEAKEAFEQENSAQLIRAINSYQEKLRELNLIAPHSLQLIEQLKKDPQLLAIKGCGALGADVLLVITTSEYAPKLRKKLIDGNALILATDADLTSVSSSGLIEGNSL